MTSFPGHGEVPLQAAPGFGQPVHVQRAVLQIFLAVLLAQVQFLFSKSVTTMQDVCLFESSAFIVLLLSYLFTISQLPMQIQPYRRVFRVLYALYRYPEEMYVLYSSVPIQLCH